MIPRAGKAIRANCLRCLCVTTAHRAYDCGGRTCPLYPAHPFRGKLVPEVEAGPGSNSPETLAQLERLHEEVPKRRPSRRLIRRMCRMCQEDRVHCHNQNCPLLPLTPYQPGGQPKRQRPPAQGEGNPTAEGPNNEFLGQRTQKAGEDADQLGLAL